MAERVCGAVQRGSEFLCNVDERIKYEVTLRWPEAGESGYTEMLEQLVDISKSFSILQV
jgi:hypothetical protein